MSSERPYRIITLREWEELKHLRALVEELEAELAESQATASRLIPAHYRDTANTLRKRVEELEAALRDIVASGAYPEAAIASSALGGES